MTELLNMLHTERTALARKLAGVDAAIHALNGHVAPAKAAGKKRIVSAAARAKMSAAQKKRWAKVKK
jgi:hypothetical protein